MEKETKDTKELTKVLAMQRFGRRTLPRKAAEGDMWAMAILLVLKGDGNEYYVVQGTDANGRLAVKEDFAGNFGIKRVISAHPISKLNTDIKGKAWKSCTRVDKITYLDTACVNFVPSKATLEQMEDEELDEMCFRVMRLTEQTRWNIDHELEKD